MLMGREGCGGRLFKEQLGSPDLSPYSTLAPSFLGERLKILFFFFFFFFLLFRAALAAYRSSQERGQIRAVAAGLRHSHSNIRSELCL